MIIIKNSAHVCNSDVRIRLGKPVALPTSEARHLSITALLYLAPQYCGVCGSLNLTIKTILEPLLKLQ
jgi:hypothetical protein